MSERRRVVALTAWQRRLKTNASRRFRRCFSETPSALSTPLLAWKPAQAAEMCLSRKAVLRSPAFVDEGGQRVTPRTSMVGEAGMVLVLKVSGPVSGMFVTQLILSSWICCACAERGSSSCCDTMLRERRLGQKRTISSTHTKRKTVRGGS